MNEGKFMKHTHTHVCPYGDLTLEDSAAPCGFPPVQPLCLYSINCVEASEKGIFL